MKFVSRLVKLVTCLALIIGVALAVSSPALAGSSNGSISGNVTAATGGAPLSGICVAASQNNGSALQSATTDVNGNYTISGLATGNYNVEFSPTCGSSGNYLAQWYDNETSASAADAVSVVSGSTTTSINAAMQTPGSISGAVTTSVGDAGLSGICVQAYTSNNTSTVVGNAITAGDGTYTITGLGTGNYDVEFLSGCGNSGNYLSQWYDNEVSALVADPVFVTAGTTTSSINAQMVIGGTIAGTVTAATGGAQLSGICVDANEITGSRFGSAVTAANGTYAIPGLASGSYTVEFFADCGNTGNLLTQWYLNQPSQGTADAVSVTAGSTTGAINAALITGGTITGTVTAAGSSVGLGGVCVSATQINGTAFETATTAANGTYTITVLATGSYTVEFSPDCGNSGDYRNQWYDNESSAGLSDPVNVVDGSTTSSINAAMEAPGTISGTVTAATGGAPLSGICVNVSQIDGVDTGSTTTGSNGTYSISGLGSGTYDVEFSTGCANTGNYLTQWYNAEGSLGLANPVTVVAGQITSSVNAAMVTGGTIAGTVTEVVGGNPVSGICIDVYTTTDSNDPVGNAISADNGTYAISGLASGVYNIEFSGGCGNSGNLITQWYNNEPSSDTADQVTVTAGVTTGSINAAMAASGAISGTVTAASGGAPLTGICVGVYATNDPLDIVGSTTTADDGTYTVAGLTTGSYAVQFSPDCGTSGNFGQQWYNDQISQSGSTPVPVISGATTPSIDAALPVGGTITGTVTAASGGADLSEICVYAYAEGDSFTIVSSTSTDSDGTYALTNLAPGSYDVEFASGCGNTGNLGQQWYHGENDESSADAVVVNLGQTTPAINAALQAGGTITGSVTMANGGAPVSGICANVYTTDNLVVPIGISGTAADGTYAVSGLAAGNYDVEFTPTCGTADSYGVQWYDDQDGQAQANVVAVSEGVTTSSINASLSNGGTVTGTVTAAVGGADLAGICVDAYTPGANSRLLSTATTAGDGTYTLANVIPGTYDVEFTSQCGATSSFLSQWYNNAATQNLSTPVVVGPLETTPSISAAMVLATPTVTGVTPGSGPVAGGNSVTITGTNLTGALTVSFGASPATLTANSATSITATAPARSVGPVNVTVTTEAGTSAVSSADTYTYVPRPTVTSVAPNVGATTGGSSVTITGTNLSAASSVRFGSATGSITADSANSVTATSPAGSAGTIDITVTTPGGTSGTSANDEFTYVVHPSVASISPSSGSTTGGTTVVISGSHLSSATAVDFGLTPGTITANSASSITVTSPAEGIGTVDVTVTTSVGSSATSPADEFTYALPPTVSGVAPSSGSTNGGTSVTISGTNLGGATAVAFGALPGSITADSATSITATYPAHVAGTIDVTVTTGVSTSSTSSADHFTYVAPPAVTGVSPTSGPAQGGTAVTISGTNLGGASLVDFGTTPASVTADSATSITATSPAESAGAIAVTVTTAGGVSAISNADLFTYIAPPTVNGVSPPSGSTVGGTLVTVTGTNLSGETAVDFGGNAGIVTSVSSTSISVTSPAGSSGTVDVTVETAGGTSGTSPADQFTYVAPPTVTGVAPTSGTTVGGTSVVISGTNLSGATLVDFGMTSGTITADTANSLTVTSPGGSAGTIDVTVTTAGGPSATSSADHFTYVTPPPPAPVVTSVSPASGGTGGGTSVTVTGSNLGGASTVSFGGTPGIVTADTATSITVGSPAEGAGQVDVTVTTAGGTSGLVAADEFTFIAPPPAPVVTGISPTSGSTGGGTTVTISGVHLGGATAVNFDATPGVVTADASGSVTVTSPSGPAGAVDVTVVTAGGTSATSLSDQFTYVVPPTPIVTSISPSTGTTEGGTSVTVTGSNLSNASAVEFGGTPGVVTADTSGSLTVTSPVEVAGDVNITVFTPGGTSATLPADQFTYVAPMLSNAYVPLAPKRICDTRPNNPSGLTGRAAQCNGNGSAGSTLGSKSTLTINVTNGFGVPANATAVVLNVTVANPQGSGYLTVYPAGAEQPLASNINYVPLKAIPNLVQVGIGTGGDVSFYSLAQADVVVDLEGYTSAAAANGSGAGLYQALASPVRICDTRPGNPSALSPPNAQCNGAGNVGETLPAKGTLDVQVTGNNGIPLGAAAAVFNVTVANPTGSGYLTVYPQGVTQPVVSNVNYSTDQVTANRVIVPLSATGEISVYSQWSADVIIDVSGYFTAAGGSGTQFTPEPAPVRICDTRDSNPSDLSAGDAQCNGNILGSNQSMTVNVTGLAGVPANAKAVVINLTGVAPTAPMTYLTVFPGPTRPTASDLNLVQDQIKANLVVATLSANGKISIYNQSGNVNVVIDVLGWYS